MRQTMTPDYRLDYWIEAVESALEDVNKLDMFSNDEIKSLAETLQGSSEQESMAFGTEHIPNSLETEIRNIKTKHKKEIEQYENREFIFRKNVSDRHGPYVDPRDVYINGNDVVYDHKGL